ncbi:translation initiation factor eIF2B beta subunit [Schizosaccharomyces pombe]|uniref:Translation initiation factor eIF2B subunit beta n=2 Tax=Schizosaccharomyces pombe (strain 972 / ATCC 24843) TaxID=284812 RepID=EI2BB_SCHPO|nr:putative translation initiation factor eIF2B beta subunit [Schizosaccharomyces pombe]Q9UT76.1 RecName: Full=Translation initiation factor eIF2B subunit beta; AltName: Full=eIF2B GDP-GTP exchange factor subunit beta [Schizosaccharomyces pombe 972h-]CAB52277.1 translation initiation factor eIF2B beta subunit (predicted) [Schizosaccharomyces pombe]|eukprot:NP_593435.1 putative translation initiation factor eIF2B beta subunit [Schizosaccharomyces pombe]
MSTINVEHTYPAVSSLIADLKSRKVQGPFAVAVETALVMRQVISQTRWSTVDQLIDTVRAVGSTLVKAQPTEFSCGNIIRRILRLIREEYQELLKTADENEKLIVSSSNSSSPSQKRDIPSNEKLVQSHEPVSVQMYSSMLNLLGRPTLESPTHSKTVGDSRVTGGMDMRAVIISGIQDVIDELDKINTDIEVQSMDHLHSNEIILTQGCSKTVEAFLRFAAKKRKFSVIVAEGFPNNQKGSHAMAKRLAQAGIDTTVISDATIFAIMSRVNKVILGTHAILGNGGLVTYSGAQLVAQAARHHATPVVVCSGIYKLSPVYPYDLESIIQLSSPDKIMSFNEGDLISRAEILNPYYDYIPPDLVDLFITNLGGYPPSYLYRIMNDTYDASDTIL